MIQPSRLYGGMGERRYKYMYEYVKKSEYASVRKELEEIMLDFIEKRIAECKKLGFTKMVIPRNNYEVVKDTKGIEIWPVDNLRQAINIVLGGNK